MARLYTTVNAVDVSSKVTLWSTVIRQSLTHESDECSFLLRDPVNQPREGQAIQVYLDTTANMLFAGVIQKVFERPISTFTVKEYALSCADYSKVLELKRVVEAYVNKTCKFIIENIITNYVAAAWGITTTNVKTGPTIQNITFDYLTPADCIRKICRISGYEWYVDYDKDVHFFDQETQIAPYQIIDSSLFPFESFGIEPDFTQVRNKITIIGGNFLSTPSSQTYAGDDVTTEFVTTHLPHELIANENSVSKTIGIENITDPATVDYLLNYWEKTLTRTAGALPAGITLTVTYSHEIRVITHNEDAAAQTEVQTLEGGDGIHEYALHDKSIASIEEAEKTGLEDLAKNSRPIIKGKFITYTDGFGVGQLLTINLTGNAYNGEYQIQEMTMNSIGGGEFRYDISFARKKTKIEDIIVKLIRKSDVSESISEGIDKIKSVAEVVEIDDSISTTLQNIVAIPYTWGSDVNEGIWNLAEWQ